MYVFDKPSIPLCYTRTNTLKQIKNISIPSIFFWRKHGSIGKLYLRQESSIGGSAVIAVQREEVFGGSSVLRGEVLGGQPCKKGKCSEV